MIAAGTKVYFALNPADMRRSFDGLAALASSELERDPARGGLFVFTNRRGNQVRILFRDPRGWCVLAKRLDRGRFRRPVCEEGRVVWEADGATLLRFLDEIDIARSAARTYRATAAGLRLVRPDAHGDLAPDA
jgi:transposase